MKLWLQVLFAQGYLWHEHFPEHFAALKQSTARPKWQTFLPLGLAVVGLIVALGGNTWGWAVLVAGLGWFLYVAYPLRLDRRLGTTEAWISITWTGGLIALMGTAAMIAQAILSGTWNLLVAGAGIWLCVVTMWLKSVEANYLLFADPDRNGWRLDPKMTHHEGNWLHRWRHLLVLTYWHLPRQILFDIEPPRPVKGAA